MILRLLFLIVFICFVSAMFAQTETPIAKDDKMDFEIMVIPNITIDKNMVITEESTYISDDKIEISTKIIYFKTIRDSQKAILEKMKNQDKCGRKFEVTDEEKEKVGIRFVCQKNSNPKELKKFIILFTYGSQLFVLSSSTLRHLTLFEKDICPHSSILGGRTCPKIYLKKNWVDKN